MNESILGIDIAKDKFDCALLLESSTLRQSFSNNLTGFKALRQWLKKASVVKAHACMEATGFYWKALAEHLLQAKHKVSCVNPCQIKHYGRSMLTRNKNDQVDALVIAQFCRAQNPVPWVPPSPAQRQLQDLTRLLYARKCDLVSERNRSKSGFSCPIVKKNIKITIKAILKSIRELETQIAKVIASDPELSRKAALLKPIKGLGPASIAVILAELPDLQSFHNASQAAAYAGVTPRQFESGSSVKGRTRMCKTGNKRLRLILFFPAIVASKTNPILKARAERLLAAGKSKMCVIGAIMHHLLRMAFAILKSGQPFDPAYTNRGNKM